MMAHTDTDPCLAAFAAALGGPTTDDERQKNRIRYEAQRRGSYCGKCGNGLSEHGPIWRARISIGPGFFGGWRYGIVPVCEACRGEFAMFYDPQPCEHCGRSVHIEYGRGRQRRRIFCSDICASRDQAADARRKRAEAREPRPCDECGETFEPTRNDAKFCTIACKQRAYRRRVTDDKCVAGGTFDSRNGLARNPSVTDDKCGDVPHFASRNACGIAA